MVQLQDDIAELNEMLNEMQSFCSTSEKFKSLSDVQKGESYAVYDDDTRMWIRLVIETAARYL